MPRHHLSILLPLLLAFVPALIRTAEVPVNVLLIITDEHNFRTLGCYRDLLPRDKPKCGGAALSCRLRTWTPGKRGCDLHASLRHRAGLFALPSRDDHRPVSTRHRRTDQQLGRLIARSDTRRSIERCRLPHGFHRQMASWWRGQARVAAEG